MEGDLFDLAAWPPRAQALLDAAPDGMLVVAADGEVLLANAQVEVLFGYPRQELVGAPVELLVPERFRNAHPSHRERYASEPRTRPMGAGLDLYGRRKDGSEFPAEISLSPLAVGEATVTIAAIRDISERKKAEAAQRSLVSGASELLSSALDTTAVCDGVARLAVVHIADACEVALLGPNRDIERIAFARRGDGEGGALPAPSHESAAVREAVARAMERRRPERVDDRDGGPASMHVLVVPLVARGVAIGALVLASSRPGGPGDLAVAEDLAHRTAIGIDNARLFREAREANAAKDRFLALLGHELRNPLGAASSALQVIERVRRWDDRLERNIAIVERQVRLLTRLVEDLLDVSRITAGKVALRREMVDLRDVARRSVESHSIEAAGRRQELMLSAASNPVWVEGDAARLEQIVNNLLINAIKYTQQGGNIRVEVRRQAQEAVLRVQDDGAGIDPPLLPRIFDLFTQGDESLDHAHGGLGLGLSVVRNLVELHGGRVSAHSDGRGKGSEFVVRLPLFWEAAAAAPKPRRSAPDAASSPTPQPSRHLLIVEDNPDAREALKELLQMNGHQVEVAEDGQQGLDVALTQHPEAAFVDIGLPVLDGYEVARRLREHFGEHGIRLIALTGYGQPEDRARALAAGFDVHLVKPVDLEAVNQTLSSLNDLAGQAVRQPRRA